jgi:hypothetical protein
MLCSPFFLGLSSISSGSSSSSDEALDASICELFVVGGIQHLFVNPIDRRPKSGTILLFSIPSCRLYCQSGCLIPGTISSIIIAFFNLPGQAAQVRLGEILSCTTSNEWCHNHTIQGAGQWRPQAWWPLMTDLLEASLVLLPCYCCLGHSSYHIQRS